jgi:hypothetical protein
VRCFGNPKRGLSVFPDGAKRAYRWLACQKIGCKKVSFDQPLLLRLAAPTTPHSLTHPTGSSQSPYRCTIILLLGPPGRSVIIMDDPPPTAKSHKTTTEAVAAAEKPAILDEETRGAIVKDDRTVINLLRSLPAGIVANYIYPFAVKVIQNHEELIEAVDEYLDEYYSDDDGDEDDQEEYYDEDEPLFDEDELDSSYQNRIHYPEWTTLPVCLTTRGTARPCISTKTCPDGMWRMGSVLPECFWVAMHSNPTFPIGTPAARRI